MTLGTVMGSGLPSTHAIPRGCWPGVEPALPKGLGQLLGALSCLGNTLPRRNNGAGESGEMVQEASWNAGVSDPPRGALSRVGGRGPSRSPRDFIGDRTTHTRSAHRPR